MVQSYEEIAEIAAKYKFLVDYHGAFKPAGIERVWPNLLTYEGVMGNDRISGILEIFLIPTIHKQSIQSITLRFHL